MGVHVGPVVRRGENVHGDTINRCARIRGIGHGGQTLLSLAAHDAVRERLPESASLRSLGAHRMKDLTEPESVWQLDHPELPTEFPPLVSLERVRHNLPLQLTSLVGRATEVGDLVAGVRGGARLTTVTGLGGMGKTRLALAAAAELADDFSDGVWFVDLSAVTEAADVPREVGGALGVRDGGQGHPAAIADHVVNKRLLLVMDNLEQVLGCAPFVARILERGSGVQVLATSRVPLGLRGESRFRLEPFPVGGSGDDGSAATLFTDRARDVRKDFSARHSDAIAEICARLEGVPLAIELAAAQVSVLTPERLLERLQRSLPLLGGAEEDRPERHRTVRAMVQWSYDLLTDDERSLLTRLAVFPGSAGLDAIEGTCASVGDEPLDVLPLLRSLVEKSLVRRTDHEGEPRFSLLVPVREFAAEHLDYRTGRALADAHLSHFLARSVEGTTTADAPGDELWTDEQARDIHNFRAALAHAHGVGRPHDRLLLAVNLFEWWFSAGHTVEGREEIRDARQQVGGPRGDADLWAFSATVEIWMNMFSPDVGATIALAHDAVDLADECGDLLVRAFAQQTLASVLTNRAAARAAFEAAVELSRTARDAGCPIRWGVTRPDAVEIGAGQALLFLLAGTSDRRSVTAEVQALQRMAAKAGRTGTVAYLDLALAETFADVGDLAAAEPLFLRAAEGYAQRQDSHYAARATLGLACARVRAGIVDQGALTPLVADLRDVDPARVADAEMLIGDLASAAGDHEAASSAYARAWKIQPNAPWLRWRSLQLERLAGVETRDRLARLYDDEHTNRRWALRDLLGCLVEGAVVALATGRSEEARALVAAVAGSRGELVLPACVETDLAALEERYGGVAPVPELPATLFG